MEALNDIEKITLLLSTSIVVLINLLVLIERIKKSDKQLSSVIIQKLLGIKNTFLVFCIVVLMSSCSTSKFLNRKYTFGRFTENLKSPKHNTIYVDTTKRFSSSNNQIELKKSPISLNEISDKEIINKKVGLIIKKDSIFIYKKKGKDTKTVVKNDLPTVITHIDINGKRIKSKILTPIVAEKIKRNQIAKVKAFSIMSLCFALIPILGFAFAISAKKILKQGKKTNPFPYLDNYNVISNVGLAISIIPSLIFVCAAVFLIFAIIMFAFGSSAMVVLPI